VGVDVRVETFSLALGLLAGLLFAVVPAWRSAGLDVSPLLQPSRQRPDHRMFGHPMIIVQVTLAIVLVCGAVMAGRALVSVLRVPLGFSPENVVTLNVTPYHRGAEAFRQFFVDAVQTLAARPDVLSVGAGASTPLDNFRVEATRESQDHPPAGIVPVLPGYVETLQIRLLRGRLPDWQDLGTGTAVVSESAARALFPDRDPIGATVTTAGGRQLTIVGLVGDVLRSFDQKALPPIYALPGDVTGRLTLLVRVRSRQVTTLASLRHDVAALTPGDPVIAGWWTDTIDAMAAYRNPRLQAIVLGSFGLLALGLTGLGIFAVVTFLVTRRTREMGVRLALGAPPRSLVALVVRQVATPVVLGVVLGSIGALWVRRIAGSQLSGLDANDPTTFIAAIAVVCVAAVVAAYLPARRASHVDPVVVLRAE
jgi:predicted permease